MDATTEATPTTKHAGRPRTVPREKIFDALCWIIAHSHKSLEKALAEANLQLGTDADIPRIYEWMKADEKLAKEYARAKEDQADYLVEEMIEIAEEKPRDRDGVNRNRLRVDTRKWVASKLKAKKYGERLDLGAGDGEIRIHISYEDKP